MKPQLEDGPSGGSPDSGRGVRGEKEGIGGGDRPIVFVIGSLSPAPGYPSGPMVMQSQGTGSPLSPRSPLPQIHI